MKLLLALSLVVASLPLSAAVPLEQAIELCRAEQNALRRLTCYDGISADTATAAPAAIAQQKTATAVQQKAAATPQQSFGLEHKQLDEEAPEQLSVTVKSVDYSPRKELIVAFTNGQRWRQVGNEHYQIEVGEQHFIKRGVLNSFFLANAETNRTVRIKREK